MTTPTTRTIRLGILHPGAMGASLAACARASASRVEVCWVSAGRSRATAARAAAEGLRDLASVERLVAEADALVSVCPPSEATAVAEAIFGLGFSGTYVDANAINPATARSLAEKAVQGGAEFVDGGIVGPPARAPGSTVLYLSGSGDGPERVAALFAGSALETLVLSGGPGRASALKMAYAAYTKGNAALLLAVRALAQAEGVEAPLLGHWARTHPQLETLSRGSAVGSAPKAWRFAGEMLEIAATFEQAGLPAGFHEAAAELYARLAGLKDVPDPTLAVVLARLLEAEPGDLPRS